MTSSISYWRLVVKGLGLFILANIIFAFWNPTNLGNISAYNVILHGRERFPFGENPAQSYNLSLFDMNAMFASHVLADGLKPEDEYRVLLIGDSSVWGTLLQPEQTLVGQLNASLQSVCNGQRIRVYNLGYPTISLMKDLMILDQAMRYNPDLVIWLVTLEAFPVEKQLTSPIVANNAARVSELVRKYELAYDTQDPALVQPTWWDRTIIGQRRNLADLLRLQLYGVLWSATGVDQYYPADYQPALTDFDVDESFHDMQPPTLNEDQLAFDLLHAGLRAVGEVPLIIVNEPMLISSGENSHIRYNFFYPKWAYDQYRQMMESHCQQDGWDYIDLWDIAPAEEFTNSAIHLTPYGESLLADPILAAITRKACP